MEAATGVARGGARRGVDRRWPPARRRGWRSRRPRRNGPPRPTGRRWPRRAVAACAVERTPWPSASGRGGASADRPGGAQGAAAGAWTRTSPWIRACAPRSRRRWRIEPGRTSSRPRRVADLAGERGGLLVEERLSGEVSITDAATRRCLDAVAAAGGGRLAEAVRRDATGGVRRLLARAVWMPDLDACLAIQAIAARGLGGGVRDGSAVVDDMGVTLGAADSVLERRAEHARLDADLERAESELAELQRAVAAGGAAANDARAALDAARADETRMTAERRRAEEAERAVARESEAIAREVAWHEAQRTRLDGGVGAIARGCRGDDGSRCAGGRGHGRSEGRCRGCRSRSRRSRSGDDPSALAAWEARSSRAPRPARPARGPAGDTGRDAPGRPSIGGPVPKPLPR